ncbi:hypothetical protein GCM10010912_17810 [Paenibacillus albidus]|uniref:Uncharacterized protein n=1 Tax=Paenibacillus albidus TaxID=2041023 RepID=A0A917C6G4_9BACL|nr:hypothetical protein GCM10010912_17810 [Paenibacillus albidus]
METKPIPNWPGYSISADGQVFSSRKSIDGTPKLLKTNSQGAVQLRGISNNTKWRRTADLVKEIWE